MYIPYISSRCLSSSKTQQLQKRRARIRRNISASDSDPESDPDDRGNNRCNSINIPYANTEGFRVTTHTDRKSPIPDAFVIPPGQPFEGRMSGGSGRRDIFGTRIYGSGYPGESGRGTSGRGFPFIFWPISWPFVKSGPGFDYLYANGEYGDPTNSTRLGGPLMVARFTLLNNTSLSSTSFRILADNMTVVSLLDSVMLACDSRRVKLTTDPISPYTNSGDMAPGAESVIQYYRASSIALALEGYNNTAIHSPVDDVFDTPMPTLDNGATDMLSCLNRTIGRTAPLVTSVIKEKPAEPEPSVSPATTAIVVICSLFGFCVFVAVLMRCISIRRRRRASAARF